MIDEPRLIEGGFAIDDRGSVSFINDFSFEGIKRYYQVENFSTNVIRAIHAHKEENKYVLVPKGTVKVVLIKMNEDNTLNLEEVKTFVLSSKKPNILFIPKMWGNGFRTLEEGTIVQFYSTSTLEESKGDDYRFDWDICGKNVWETKNR